MLYEFKLDNGEEILVSYRFRNHEIEYEKAWGGEKAETLFLFSNLSQTEADRMDEEISKKHDYILEEDYSE